MKLEAYCRWGPIILWEILSLVGGAGPLYCTVWTCSSLSLVLCEAPGPPASSELERIGGAQADQSEHLTWISSTDRQIMPGCKYVTTGSLHLGQQCAAMVTRQQGLRVNLLPVN